MAWDSSRPVPWKRLLTYLGIYAAVMVVITLIVSGEQFSEALPGLLIGLVLATAVMVAMTKFGWTLPMLRSREEVADIRTERAAAKSKSSTGPAPSSDGSERRERPAATKRTSTGHSQHPRRTTKTRKR